MGDGQWVVHNSNCLTPVNVGLSSEELGKLPGTLKELTNRGYQFSQHFLDQWLNEGRGAGLTADDIINVLKNGSHILRDGDVYNTAVGKVGKDALSIVYDSAGTLHSLFDRGIPQSLFQYIVRPDFPFDL